MTQPTDDTATVAAIIREVMEPGSRSIWETYTDAELVRAFSYRAAAVRLALRQGARDALTKCAAWLEAEESGEFLCAGMLGEAFQHVVRFRETTHPALMSEKQAEFLTSPAPTRTLAHVVAEYEWHDDGWKKEVYAEKDTGRIVGSIDDQSAYIVATGFLGRYITPSKAREAVERVIAAEAQRLAEGT